MNCELRALTPKDEAIVWQMLVYAAHEPSEESVREQPNLARYAINWGRNGDRGYVALVDGLPVGAAWLRLWLGDRKGFGYVNDSIPELAIGILPQYRGKGIGTQLLDRTIEEAKPLFSAISLSVRLDNPVVKLYERIGFVKLENSQQTNRTGGTSLTMIYQIKG